MLVCGVVRIECVCGVVRMTADQTEQQMGGKKKRISLERENQKKGKAETGKKGENHLKVGKTANGGKRRGWRVTERSGETKAEKGDSRNGQKGRK